MKAIRKLTALLLVLFFSNALFAARYWIANVSSNWNDAANWSATSGGVGGDGVPTAADDVIFDANGAGDCTLDAAVNINSIVVNGYAGIVFQGSNTIIITSQATFSSGTFSGGSGNITVGGAFTLSGAAFTATSGVMEVNGSTVAFASGTFNHNNGSIKCNRSGLLTLSGATTTVYNLEFVGATGQYNVTTTALIVAGTLTTSGSHSLHLTTPVAGTSIQAQGDISINNTYSINSGTAVILINGAGNQLLTSSVAGNVGHLPYITIQKPSGILTLAGNIPVQRDWAYVSGTVDAASNASTVTFGMNSLSIASQGMSFYNVVISSSTITASTDLTIEGNLTISGTGILAAGSKTINLSGNWINRGTAGFTEATSTVRFNGTAWQTINTLGGENFANVTVNNPSSGIILQSGISVANNLNMTAGNIDLNVRNVTLGTSATAPGSLTYSSGTMISAGTFMRWFAAATIPPGGVAGLFPVGTAQNYRPFSVSMSTAPTSGGSITVRYVDAPTNTATSFADGSATVKIRKDLKWMVSSSGFAGGQYAIRISGTGYGLVSSLSDLRITLVSSVTGVRGTNGGTLANPEVNRDVLLAGVSNTFYLGSINSVNTTLPVSWVSFTVTPQNKQVGLAWQTAFENRNDRFVVQRSADAFNWQDVLQVAARSFPNAPLQYHAIDNSPLSGTSYYRVMQIDTDGKYSYSIVRAIQFASARSIQAYPNPASDHIVIVCHPDERIMHTVDLLGRPHQVPVQRTATGMNLLIGTLPVGTYYIRLSDASGFQKVVSFLKF